MTVRTRRSTLCHRDNGQLQPTLGAPGSLQTRHTVTSRVTSLPVSAGCARLLQLSCLRLRLDRLSDDLSPPVSLLCACLISSALSLYLVTLGSPLGRLSRRQYILYIILFPVQLL